VSRSENFGQSCEGGEPKTAGGKKKLKDDTLSGYLALDTSVIIEMPLSSELGKAVTEALIADQAEGYTSEVNLAEAEYVLCRRLGPLRTQLLSTEAYPSVILRSQMPVNGLQD